MSNTVPADIVKMDALRQAEDLAYRNPASHAVIYRRVERSVGPAGHQGARSVRFFVRLDGDDAPEGAEVLTTVSRKPVHRLVSQWQLQDAVRHMVNNLPQGLQLADRALIEHYPRRTGYTNQEPAVFAYQFFSTEGLNVGTWIPDVAANGVVFQLGFDGRGRSYQGGFVEGRVNGPSEPIGWMIDAAMVEELDPGKCTERYLEGWRRAEASLRHGVQPDDVGPSEAHEETFSGFTARMAIEQEVRAKRSKPAGSRVEQLDVESPRRLRP
jgi:hypothetical protein